MSVEVVKGIQSDSDGASLPVFSPVRDGVSIVWPTDHGCMSSRLHPFGPSQGGACDPLLLQIREPDAKTGFFWSGVDRDGSSVTFNNSPAF